jgi:hypothetical protein
MSINTKSFVSWGVFGGATAQSSANLFSSWGLIETAVTVVRMVFRKLESIDELLYYLLPTATTTRRWIFDVAGNIYFKLTSKLFYRIM